MAVIPMAPLLRWHWNWRIWLASYVGGLMLALLFHFGDWLAEMMFLWTSGSIICCAAVLIINADTADVFTNVREVAARLFARMRFWERLLHKPKS